MTSSRAASLAEVGFVQLGLARFAPLAHQGAAEDLGQLGLTHDTDGDLHPLERVCRHGRCSLPPSAAEETYQARNEQADPTAAESPRLHPEVPLGHHLEPFSDWTESSYAKLARPVKSSENDSGALLPAKPRARPREVLIRVSWVQA